MKTILIQVSFNPEYWGPIVMTIAAVFCIALAIHVFSGINQRMNSAIIKRLRPTAQANPYAAYYTKDVPFRVLESKRTKLRSHQRRQTKRYTNA